MRCLAHSHSSSPRADHVLFLGKYTFPLYIAIYLSLFVCLVYHAPWRSDNHHADLYDNIWTPMYDYEITPTGWSSGSKVPPRLASQSLKAFFSTRIDVNVRNVMKLRLRTGAFVNRCMAARYGQTTGLASIRNTRITRSSSVHSLVVLSGMAFHESADQANHAPL